MLSFYVCGWLASLLVLVLVLRQPGRQAERESLHDLRHTDAIAIITITIK